MKDFKQYQEKADEEVVGGPKALKRNSFKTMMKERKAVWSAAVGVVSACPTAERNKVGEPVFRSFDDGQEGNVLSVAQK